MGWLKKLIGFPPSGNLWRDFLELLGEWKLFRRGVATAFWFCSRATGQWWVSCLLRGRPMMQSI